MIAALALLAAAVTAGPPRGALVIVGGGEIGPEITQTFIDLAGGLDAPVIVVPTAGDADSYDDKVLDGLFLRKAGMKNLVVLHTRDRKVADSEAFVAPIRKARGVWFIGGRQWRLVDAYHKTRTEHELRAVLDRGGVIGGTSAGATIQGSYLVRGAREGNQIMMAPGYERGFGYLRNAAIDQHLIKRHRENDLIEVVRRHPKLLGIGIDESTALVVRGNMARVIGASKVAIYNGGAEPYFWLTAGDVFDLKLRRRQ